MSLNPWLEAKLEEKRLALGAEALALMAPLILQVEPDMLDRVKQTIPGIERVSVGRAAFNMLEVMAPLAAIPAIDSIPGVMMVHKSMVKRIFTLPRLLSGLPKPFTLTRADPFEGDIRIDDIIIPRSRLGLDMVLPMSPLRFLKHHGPLGEVEIIPTERSRQVVVDIATVHRGRGVGLAVLDTGGAPQNPQSLAIPCYSTCSSDPLPLDFHGHGSWCCSAAAGRASRGLLGPVQGVADEAKLMSIKVLHGVFGFGFSMDIIKGIERAVDLGAKVISMSLGGDECQGGCENCPECQIINDLSEKGIIFCIAAGNSGPDEWTLGCPACAAGAIAVGSVSMTDYPEPAHFSSRGPQNTSNRDMPINGLTSKPDILAPGGGRAKSGAAPDEVLYAGEEGWLKGLYSGLKWDIAGAMMGTSQATPHLAGLCAILVEKGYNSASAIKEVFVSKGHSKSVEDGWGVAKLSWFSGVE